MLCRHLSRCWRFDGLGDEAGYTLRKADGSTLKFDRVGEWSELKLQIIREYASAYSRILAAQKSVRLEHVYIDAFAGAGTHISRKSGARIPGSPLVALEVKPPFREYHFIDLDREKTAELRRLTKGRADIYVHEGDCNVILLNDVFPRVRFEDYRRALCLLDPYGLHLDWEVIAAAGKARTIDLVLNFPVADMNRNALWRDPTKVSAASKTRMSAFWGDDSWTQVAYTIKRGLFEEFPEKEDNETVANAFRKRLRGVAGFAHVTKPLPMRNSRGATVYFLFGASQKEVATKIIMDIFKKYGHRGNG